MRKGFTLIELLVVIAVIAVLAAVLFPIYASSKNQAKSSACMSNLKQIGAATTMYVDDWNGRMPICKVLWPGAKFDTTAGSVDDPQSPLVVLKHYVRNEDVFVCPTKLRSLPVGGPARLTYVFYGWDYLYKAFPKSAVDRWSKGNISYFDQWVAYNGQMARPTMQTHGTGITSQSRKKMVRDSLVIKYDGSLVVDTQFPHGRWYNCLFMDGHVAPTREKEEGHGMFMALGF